MALLLVAALGMLVCAGCTDEESDLGMNLVDSTLLYHEQHATLNADKAISVRDADLNTTGYNFGIIGRYHDYTFGNVEARLFTQIALPENESGINFDELMIDSVILSLACEQLYPDTTRTYNFHFEVMHLNEVLQTDSVYRSTDELAVDPQGVYFDQQVRLTKEDSVLRVKLGGGIEQLLNQNATAQQFIEATKGLRFRFTDAGDEGMMSIDFTSADTKLTVYYRMTLVDDQEFEYTFLLNSNAQRFMQFIHDYAGSATAGADSIDGTTQLYLEPLGGYNIRLGFDQAVRAFAEAHPLAVVHEAELLLPVQGTELMRPDRVLAMTRVGDTTDVYVNDLLDMYTLAGFDGKLDATRGCYRMRITQHVQQMLRAGGDSGMLLVLNSRRNNAARTAISGRSAANPVRIEFTYSE